MHCLYIETSSDRSALIYFENSDQNQWGHYRSVAIGCRSICATRDVPVGVCGEWFDSHTCSHASMLTCSQTGYQNKEQRSSEYNTHRMCVCVMSFCFRTPLLHYIFIQKIDMCCYFKAQNKIFTLSVAPTRQSTWGSSQKSCSLCVWLYETFLWMKLVHIQLFPLCRRVLMSTWTWY